jgi:hypothetical protein
MKIDRAYARSAQIAGLLVLLALAGCGGGNVLNPRFQPEVNNQVDNFQFQATGVTNVSQTLNYSWQNTGTQANLNQASTVASGMATLSIRDANGTMVYSSDLSGNGTFVTMSGVAGNWRIEVFLSNYSGTLNFRLQKRP